MDKVRAEKVLEGAAVELVGGSALCGSPLSESLSPQTSPALRGYNLYLPVPYAQSCKVAYESADLWREKSVWKREAYYYNVETRTYPAGTVVDWRGKRTSNDAAGAAKPRRAHHLESLQETKS